MKGSADADVTGELSRLILIALRRQYSRPNYVSIRIDHAEQIISDVDALKAELAAINATTPSDGARERAREVTSWWVGADVFITALTDRIEKELVAFAAEAVKAERGRIHDVALQKMRMFCGDDRPPGLSRCQYERNGYWQCQREEDHDGDHIFILADAHIDEAVEAAIRTRTPRDESGGDAK